MPSFNRKNEEGANAPKDEKKFEAVNDPNPIVVEVGKRTFEVARAPWENTNGKGENMYIQETYLDKNGQTKRVRDNRLKIQLGLDPSVYEQLFSAAWEKLGLESEE